MRGLVGLGGSWHDKGGEPYWDPSDRRRPKRCDAYVAAVVGAKDFSDGEQWPMTMYMVTRLGVFSFIGSWRELFFRTI